MTTFTEGRRAAGFIISEANGSLSRDNGIVKAGEVLQAGEIVALDGSELVAWTDGDAAGIMLYPINASAQATPAAYLARQAEVNAELLVYPDDVEEADALAALVSLGIVTHAANIGAGGGGGGGEEDDEMPLISSGVVANQKYFDVALPAGYVEYELRVQNIISDGTVDGVVSMDGGATFVQDLVEYDTYKCQQWQAGNNATSVSVSMVFDVLANLQTVGTSDISDLKMRILPGDASHSFRLRSETTHGSGGGLDVESSVCILNAAATIPPTYGRIDVLRIQVYGDGTAGVPNPAITDKITSCTWTLRGEPTPS